MFVAGTGARDAEDFVSPSDAARMLGLTPQAVRDQARRGQLPCVIRRVGARRHRYLFPRAAIEALVPSVVVPARAGREHDLSTADVELALAQRELAALDKALALARAENDELRRRLDIVGRALQEAVAPRILGFGAPE